MKKLLLSLFASFVLVLTVLAQNRTVTGTVTAKDDGQPLPGVSVKVKGSSNGTQTGPNGRYSLSVPANAVLVFSYIGFTQREIPVGASENVSIALATDAKQLTEVIVTGAYGLKQSSRAASSDAQVVSQEQLNPIRQTNLNNGLAGKVAGIQVRSQSAATLGRNTEIRLRGASGFGTGSGALYVVDGTIVPNIDDINLDDIDNVSVLQGPASSAQFGSQGANGAIVITTSRGKKADGVGITLNLGANFDNAYVLPNYQNTYAGGAAGDLMQYNWKQGDPEEWKALDGKYYHDYSDDSSWGPKMVGQEYVPWYAWYPGTKYSYKTASLNPQKDNAKDYFNTGVTLNNGLIISKAADNFAYKLSYNNQYVRGLIPNSDLKKNVLNFNTSYDLNKYFTASANINYVTQKVGGEGGDGSNDYDAYSSQSSGSFNQWFHRDLDMNIMNELRGLTVPDATTPVGLYGSWNHANPSSYDPSNPRAFYAGNYWYNFYTYYDLANVVNQRDRLYGDVAFTYKVNNDLKFTATYRKNLTTTLGEAKYSSQLNYSGLQTTGNNPTAKGFYGTAETYSNRQNYEFLASYNKQIQDFTIGVNAGTDIFSWDYKDNAASTVNGLSVDDLFTVGNSVDQPAIGNGRVQEKYRAVLGTASVGYKNFLFLNATLRNDWFSTLPADNNSILSKSFGGSFVFSDLLPSTKPWLSYGKARVSYGEIPQALGTSTTTFGAYRYPGGLYGVSQYKYGTNILMSTPDQFVDPSIQGTVTASTEFGLELSFLNNRLNVEGTYYTGKDKNIPQSLGVNGASGYSTILTNIGLIKRTGLELTLGGTPVKSPNFQWNINATFSRLLKNDVEEVSKKYDVTRITPSGAQVWGSTMPYLVHEEGKRWGQIYGNGIKRNENGVPLLTSSGAYINDPNVYFGSVLPMYTGGLQNSFTVMKDFVVNVNIDYQYGGKFVSLSNMWGSYSGLTARTAALNDKGVPVRDAVADGGGVHVFGVDQTTGSPADYYVDAKTYYQNLYNNKTFDDYIYDLSFIKLRELSIGYKIPVKKLNINKYVKNATVSLTGRNLWLLYSTTKDFDPSEVSYIYGETAQLPGTRGFGFNLRVGF
ncbi:SusC/RagA family TonB-linked outer membrane protein [Pedobacter sp. HMF7647]|uniref:SusC/RagA family TonB-linked outer membrane protein n=1 Tax=Hufsiella arboris TaxID=2695275 RepID=A0A7K1Y5L8_9SPHI|nr:SusC/RagA family TonB-linked outer membrane protein [Hufsiella arboris]MXV49883.1 SusC/RagA family TonB-linked outer membrane protein [Hufsiella arboris]